MIKHSSKLPFSIFLFSVFVFSAILPSYAQMSGIDRSRMKEILKAVKSEVNKEYYDSTFGGVDLDKRFARAEARLDEVKSVGEAFSAIAQALIDFNDSHLFFIPPMTNKDVEYGWRARMNGDKYLITTIQPKSDAEKKGLKVGDEIVSIEGFRPVKKEMWKVDYFYNLLSKRTFLTLEILSPGEKTPRKLQIESKISTRPNSLTAVNLFRITDPTSYVDSDKHLFVTVGDTTIWKMPTFGFDWGQVDNLMSNAKKSNKLIIDLRGNGGGYVKTMERIAGYLFDKDLTIAELKGRKPMDPMLSKTKGKDAFTGKLAILIDGRSASAAEILARLVQLEKRGIVIGETSAGAVMQSRTFDRSLSNISEFWISITNADVIMSDGKSLEHTGVIPDETVILSGEDLAKRRDPVLARAAELLGTPISSETAGNFWEYKWRNDGLFVDFSSKK